MRNEEGAYKEGSGKEGREEGNGLKEREVRDDEAE